MKGPLSWNKFDNLLNTRANKQALTPIGAICKVNCCKFHKGADKVVALGSWEKGMEGRQKRQFILTHNQGTWPGNHSHNFFFLPVLQLQLATFVLR